MNAPNDHTDRNGKVQCRGYTNIKGGIDNQNLQRTLYSETRGIIDDHRRSMPSRRRSPIELPISLSVSVQAGGLQLSRHNRQWPQFWPATAKMAAISRTTLAASNLDSGVFKQFLFLRFLSFLIQFFYTGINILILYEISVPPLIISSSLFSFIIFALELDSEHEILHLYIQLIFFWFFIIFPFNYVV